MPSTSSIALPLLFALAASAAHADTPPTIKSTSADRSQAGNPPAHAFDADPGTKWAANGRGRVLQAELSAPHHVSAVGVGFAHPERDYTFAIEVSAEGKEWSPPVLTRSARQDGVKLYKISPAKIRFLRLTVHGSDANDWANIHTVEIPGVPALKLSNPDKPTIARGDGYVVSEWASDPAIKDSVALSLDDHGNVYLNLARRRKQSSLDIRHHGGLVKKDLSLTTVEERRAWYKEAFTGQKWLPDRNGDGTRDWRDLTVQKDNVSRVSDTDGDGRGDTVTKVDEYHSEVTGITAGALAVGSDLFVAAEPDFLRYTDADGDGLPETRQLVATGFQVHMGQGGHNLSGVALGSDGRVYWSLGDKGHHVTTDDGTVYHMPNAGAIFRCELDGTGVERFSTGERNAQELAFDAHGNLFSMDNDGDYPGEMERALYITEGSEHGWRLNWQWLKKQDFVRVSGLPAYNPWMDEKLFLPDRDDHAAYLTPTIGNFGPGPCGFTANPGTALSAAHADHFFMTNQKNEVRVFSFKPAGASFTFEEHGAIKGGNNNTGLAFGPDGALYSASYGSGKGAVYRFDVADEDQHPARADTQKALRTDASKQSRESLQAWLDHPDRRVRMKGQIELARRRDTEGLFLALQSAVKTPVGRLHALWGLGQIARRHPGKVPLSLFLPAWSHDEPELVAQATNTIGDTPGTPADLAPFVQKLLDGFTHPSPRVRFFTALAAGKRGFTTAAPHVVALLESDDARSDPYLRHAGVMGLKGTMSPADIAALHTHANRTVRLAAVVALRKLASPELRAFFADTDELVLREAARAVHDDASVPAALPDLAAVLDRRGLADPPLLRRAINAALRTGSTRDLDRLDAFVDRGDASSDLLRTAFASVLWWDAPPVLDPVEGRYREHAPRDRAPADRAVARLKSAVLNDPDLLDVLLRGATVRDRPAWLDGTHDRFPAMPAAAQVRFLDALATTGAPDLRSFVEPALASPHAAVREAARSHAAKAGIPPLDLLLAVIDDPDPAAGQGKAVRELAKLDTPEARAALEKLAAADRAGQTPPHWQLELQQAAASKGIDLADTPQRLEFGGNPDRGKKLVREHPAAQCVRCHQFPGTPGSTLGPDLTGIAKKHDRPHLVRSLLEPNADIADGYGTVTLTTQGGENLAGLLTAKTDKVWTLTLPDSSTRDVPADTIASHTLLSTMPPMQGILTPTQIRDIVAYLATLK